MTGFYGKLPAKGDFLSRHLPRAFADGWDEWLQSGMHDSRQLLGESWLQTYLTSPLWRFFIPGGVFGESAWAGVLMPSMDKVGRYFPMTVAAELEAGSSALDLLTNNESWFESIESLLLDALDDESLDLDGFDDAVQAVVLNSVAGTTPSYVVELQSSQCLPLDEQLNVSKALTSLVAPLLQDKLNARSIWWGHGSERIAPVAAVCNGLPAARQFVAMLDGHWMSHGWAQSTADDAILPDLGGNNSVVV